jgi:hypothetical protein
VTCVARGREERWTRHRELGWGQLTRLTLSYTVSFSFRQGARQSARPLESLVTGDVSGDSLLIGFLSPRRFVKGGAVRAIAASKN